MGEIADMMLDGTMCEMCGVFLEGEGDGFPRYCSPECARDRGAEGYEEGEAGPERIKCPLCGKVCKGQQGLQDHSRVIHEATP